MQNVSPPFVSVPQELFGGLYTEATPESLPEGASPLCINCDFIIGQVTPRPGKESVYYYEGFFIEKNTNHATSVDDGLFLNEVAWANPSNATLDTPGTYAEVNLLSESSGTPVDQTATQLNNSVNSSITLGPLVPTADGEWVLMSCATQAPLTVNASYTLLGGSLGGKNFAFLAPNNPTSFFGSALFTSGLYTSAAAMVLMYTLDGALPTIQNSNYVDVPFNAPAASFTQALPNLTTAGNTIFVILNVVSPTGATKTLTDTQGNTYNLLAQASNAGNGTFIYGAYGITGGLDQLTFADTGHFGASGDIFIFEMPAMSNATNTSATSQLLECINYNFNISSAQAVLGMQVEISGLQSIVNDEALISATFNQSGSETMTGQLDTTYGTLVLGQPMDKWGLHPTPAMLNDSNFGVNVQAFAGAPIASGGGGSGSIFDKAVTGGQNPGTAVSIAASPAQRNEWAFGAYAQSSASAVRLPLYYNISSFVIASNVLTLTLVFVGQAFNVGDVVTFSDFTGADIFMNGTTGVITNISGTTITLSYTHANYTGTSSGHGFGDGWKGVGFIVAPYYMYFQQQTNTGAQIKFDCTLPSGIKWCGGLALFGTSPSQDALLVQNNGTSFAGSGSQFAIFNNPTQFGNTIIVTLTSPNVVTTPWAGMGVTDQAGNVYTLGYSVSSGDTQTAMFYCQNAKVISFGQHITMTNDGTGFITTANLEVFEISGLSGLATTTPYTYDISAVKIKVWLTPDPPPSFNYLKTFEERAGEILNLALGSDGVMYQEDAINNPRVLTAVYEEIQPDSFAQSCTIDNREFIAISNLTNGTDIPLTYKPPNFDRLSQVGPGAPPSVTSSTSTEPINVVSITQAAKTLIRRIAWGASANALHDSTAGNVLVVYGEGKVTPLSLSLPNAVVGGTIVLSGLPALFPLKWGGNIPYNLNGTYVIQQVTTAIVGDHETCPVFLVQAPATAWGYSDDFGETAPPTSGWYYQATLATLTTDAQIPGLEIGGTLELTGTGGSPTSGYDGSWPVIGSPNATLVQITSTELTDNVATYSYTVTGGGPNPVVGQLINITGTTNGNGIFNGPNLSITTTSPGRFSVGIASATDVVAHGETNGRGEVFGTIFTFEPGVLVGTRTSGTVVTQGLISSGRRKVCYSFLTRNGYITKPSPIRTVTISEGAGSLVIGDLAIGPPNVIARIVHLTAANGGNFYNIPQDVTVQSNGQDVVNTSTWLNDNSSTQITLSFSDGVLLAGAQIDIEGNNLFALEELGSCVALIPYSNRIFAVGEQSKIFNLLNYSFDGGTGGDPGASYPLGWAQDPTYGAGGNVTASPIFGSMYQIVNASGSPQTTYGMITQNAFQDEFQTPIIDSSTTYSVRLTASCPTGAATGNLVIDLYSTLAMAVRGSFTLPLASMTTDMRIYTGTLLTTVLAPVPNDLVIRIYATNIADGVTVDLDRIEPFPTEQPNNDRQVIGSYQRNYESFDLITGIILGTNVNQQPILSAYVLFDSLYLVKSGSLINVSDNNTTEPNNWNQPRTISASVGTSGPYAVTTGIDEPNSGEEYSITAGRPGAFLYAGGQPIKITSEIQSFWNTVYWKSGATIWIKNDITNRRVLFGLPIMTRVMIKNRLVQNPWLPAGIVADNRTPLTPNVVLELNYKQIDTAGELGGSPEVHATRSGDLIASEMTRKWSVWSIKAPCAAFIERDDKTAPLFLGNSDHTGKIYDLVDGLLQDDGSAFTQDYITSPFVSSEKGQGTQMGVVRMNYDYMTMILDGSGDLAITALPNTLDTPYASQLLPDLTLPDATNGDIELPINEVGSRLFLRFTSTDIDAGFNLSRVVVAMHQDPWSPVRGVNN